MTETGWQPIATAPKDGTPVLLAEGGLIGVFAWVNPMMLSRVGLPMPKSWVGYVMISNDVMRENNWDRRMVSMHGSSATHWMPLPTPPTP